MPLVQRVARLEAAVAALRRETKGETPKQERGRAHKLIFAALQRGETIDTVDFAVKHDLRFDHVDKVLREFASRGWAERV